MTPVFSVIIPTFNQADLIQRAIDSVLNQTFFNFEIIVIDDASVDNTADVINQYDDPRIRYIRLAQNKGASTARNKGIMEAVGQYISFLDSDDEYLPEFLEETLKAINESGDDVGFLWTGTIRISEQKNNELQFSQQVKRLWTPGYQSLFEAYRDCLRRDPVWGTGHGVTFKSFVFDTIGVFDEHLKAREDIDLLIRAVKAYKFRVIPKYLIKIHTDSLHRIDGNHHNRARAYVRIFGKHAHRIVNDRKAFLFFNETIAINFFKAKYYLKAAKYLLKIILKEPGRINTYKMFISSLTRSLINAFSRRSENMENA